MSGHAHLPLPDYERTDASARGIAWTTAGIGVALLAVLVSSAVLYRHWAAEKHTTALSKQTSFANGPQVRTSIETDWAQQDSLVREHLTTYGWIDRERGVVRIPVDRAMELLAREGEEKR